MFGKNGKIALSNMFSGALGVERRIWIGFTVDQQSMNRSRGRVHHNTQFWEACEAHA